MIAITEMAQIANIIDDLENGGVDAEAREGITEINELLGDDGLETEAQTVTGAINELKSSGTGSVTINDTLTSTSTTEALSAKQGKALKDEIDTHKAEYVHVTQFGAKGDGVTDDTTAIQAAIDYVNASTIGVGGVVYFPTGNYKITSTIKLKSCVSLVGAGHSSTTIQAVSDIIMFEADYATYGIIGRLKITDLHFTHLVGAINPILKLNYSQHVYIERNMFINGGIEITNNSTHIYIDKFYCVDANRGILIDSSVRTYISNFEIDNVATIGIEITGANTDVIGFRDGEINICGTYGVYIHDMPGGFTNWSYVQLSACTTYGFYIFNTSRSTFYSCYCETSGQGFQCEGSSSLEFIACRSVGNTNGFNLSKLFLP